MSDKHPPNNKVVDFRSFERRGRKGPSSRKKLRLERQKELISKRSYHTQRNSPYYPGSYLNCRIDCRVEDGYIVTVNQELPGFLPSQTLYKIGSECIFQFVCVEKNRIIMAEKLESESNGKVANLFYRVKGDSTNRSLSEEFFPLKDNCVSIDKHNELES